MTTETTQVLFRVYVTQADDVFGVVLFVDDQTDSEVVPCFRSVFKSPTGADISIDGVTEIYAECHRNALDKVGLEGEVTLEVYESKLHESVELAAEMMSNYGLNVLDLGTVSDDVMHTLFAEEWPEDEEEESAKEDAVPDTKRTLN